MYKFLLLSVCFCVSAAYKDYHSIELPVKSKHELEEIHTPSHEEDHKTNVDIPGGVLPVYMIFKTQSSPLYVKQSHRGTKGSYQKSDSKDEPHKLVHEVNKEVYQELKEIITPYRKVIQVIEPVREERLTKVHKGERKGGYGGDDDNNGYGKSSSYGQDSGNGYGKNEDSYKEEDKYGKIDEKYSYEKNDDKYGKEAQTYGKQEVNYEEIDQEYLGKNKYEQVDPIYYKEMYKELGMA